MPVLDQTTKEVVVSLYRNLLEAWNRRDANAFAALFASDGACVGFDGSQMNGRAQIASELGVIFKDHVTATYIAKVQDVRPIGADTALLRAAAGMVPPGKNDLNPDRHAIQSLVASLQDAQWTIALFQNTPAAFHGRPHLTEQLTEELTDVQRSGGIVQTD